ncbi:LiaI-LiaF-like domain-containing protein [Aquibacillus sediminis]|uniref:LiaI-LiaF-like domain-containing protein n=1 Tax=Aquibacillus sediminis TaxID=2574734 RepID=UPI0011081A50|nr:DUF5668 domain-containing protein [Aquibacillus sediminis]
MKKQNLFVGIILIGIGGYFLLRQLRFPILTDFYSWPTLLIILGISFLFYSYISKDYKQLFPGSLLFGLGIHFHGLNHYAFWIDHWAMYPLIISIAFFVRFQKTKSDLLPGLILLIISLFAIFSSNKPGWFRWIDQMAYWIGDFWPAVLILVGIYLLVRKK